MDAFESLIASLLEREGFWIRTSVKVELTKTEKKVIGRHSSPRWEIDLVAYKGSTNELWIVECKSYFDSAGVNISAFNGRNPAFGNRFKLFNEKKLFSVVKNRLCAQLLKTGNIRPNPNVKLALAAGHIIDKHRNAITGLFRKKGWVLMDENYIKQRIYFLTNESYENSVASIVAKIILRPMEKANDRFARGR